jgi:thiol-disulfide isomerase/thioredoxin
MAKTSSCVVISAVILTFALRATADEPQGRIVGKVTVEKTGEPVAGATIMALTGISEDRPGLQHAKAEARTNDRGEYELNVPFGNVRLTSPQPPVGYCFKSRSKPLEDFVVTRKTPSITRDFAMTKGAVWNLKIESPKGKPIPGAGIFASAGSNYYWRNATDSRGEGRFTVPLDGRELKVICANFPFSEHKIALLPSKMVTVDVAEGFNTATAKFANQPESGKSVELVDDRGHKAEIDGCTIAIEHGTPLLQFTAEEPTDSLIGEVIGKVVDQDGQPVKDAGVSCIQPLLLAPDDVCRTDKDGAFRFRGYFKWSPTKERSRFALMVLKDGYIGAELGCDGNMEPFVPDSNGVHHVERSLVLKPGYVARLRVVDPNGKPVEGAWVEPNGGFSVRAQFAKSDKEGFCTVHNLPEGVSRLDVSYGEESAGAKVVVSASSAGEEPVTIRVSKPLGVAEQEPAEKAPAPPIAVKPGEKAPEWSIGQWTDGKDRELSDFRGKVVLLDFWGVWCSGCVQAIPALKKVHEKFGNQVVFISIHTPGTEMSQVKKLLVLKNWDVPVGLDKGVDVADGETAKRYGIYGFPSFIVIDKQGKIAFNEEAEEGAHDKDKVMAKAEALAKEAGVPWPIDKNVSEDEALARLEKMQVYMLSKEIEKSLKD